MDEQRQDDQLETTYSSSVPIRDVALKTYQKWRTIEKGGEKRSGISVLMVWHDDDDSYWCLMLKILAKNLEIALNSRNLAHAPNWVNKRYVFQIKSGWSEGGGLFVG